MSDTTAQELIDQQKRAFGDQEVGPKDGWQTTPHTGQIQIPRKSKIGPWLKKIRWWYVIIGAVDMGIGALSFGAPGHFLVAQIILGAFGAAATIGRVQSFRHAQSLKGKSDKPAISKRRLFLFAWIVGIFAATFFGLHFEIALVKAQSVAAAEVNAKAAAQTAMVDELGKINGRRDKYDLAMENAVKAESWNTRDAYTKLIATDADRIKEIQRILGDQGVTIAVSAKAMFGLIAGDDGALVMAGVAFLSFHLFMELMLALFASPLMVEKNPATKSPVRRRSRRGKSRPSVQ